MTAARKIKILIYVSRILLLALVLMSLFLAGFTCVNGESMLPTLQDGDFVWTARVFDKSSIGVGDIIVLKWEGIRLIKRVLATPGTVAYDESGNALSGVMGENQFFVVGDNREISYDSRSFGPIDGSSILFAVGSKINKPALIGIFIVLQIAAGVFHYILYAKANEETEAQKTVPSDQQRFNANDKEEGLYASPKRENQTVSSGLSDS